MGDAFKAKEAAAVLEAALPELPSAAVLTDVVETAAANTNDNAVKECCGCKSRSSTELKDKSVPIPAFEDLASPSHAVLHAPFNAGAFSLDFTTATKTGSKFGGNLSMQTGPKSVTSALESSHVFWGADFTMRYTSARVLEESLSVKDFVVSGLNVGLTSVFAPDTGKLNLGLKSSFSNDLATVGVAVSDNLSSVEASAVINRNGWVAGFLSSVDPRKPSSLQGSCALGFRGPDFQLLTTLAADKAVNAQVYQKLSSDAELGVELNATPGDKPSLALSHKVALSGISSVAVKIDNSSLLSVAYSTRLRDGVSLNVSGQVNAMNVAAGPNDFGVGLVVDA